MRNLKTLIEEALYKASRCSDPVIKKKANELAEDSYQMKKVNEFYARSLAEDALYLIRKCGLMEVFNRILTGTFPFSLIDSAARPLVEWNITGKTSQSGTPSPANPIEVKGVGDYDAAKDNYKVIFESRGKNWFDKTGVTFIDGLKDDDGNIVPSQSHFTEQFTSVEPNTAYIWSGSIRPEGSTTRVYFYDINKNWISRTDGNLGSSHAFTTPSNCYYVQFQVVARYNVVADWQLELGNTATEYEPYVKPTTTSIYIGTPLMEGDTLDNTGTRTVNMVKKVFTGTEGWLTSGNNIFYLENPDGKQSTIAQNYAYCSHYVDAQVPNASMPAQSMKHSPTGSGGVPNFWFKDTSIASTSAFKSYLAAQYAAGTPVIVWYPLETPRIEKVSVSSVPTVAGNSTLDIVSEVRPASAMITYKSTTEE